MILNRGERNALKRFPLDNRGYQAVSKWKGIGLPSMRSLVEKGLVVEGPSGIYGETFKLTGLGMEWRDRLLTGERREAASAYPAGLRSRNWAGGEPVLA